MPGKLEVLTQRQTIARLPDDSYGTVMRITFRTAANVVLSVDVPAADYNPETARAMIEERAAHADEIQNF